MSVIEDKAALRKAAFAARRDAHAAGGRDAADAARDVFLAASFAEGARVVSGFRPIRTEIDPTPLMEALIARGLHVVFASGYNRHEMEAEHDGLTFVEKPLSAEAIADAFARDAAPS